MEPNTAVDGRDVDLKLLQPLHERELKLKTHAGFRKIVASIKAIGLIEPLSVYQENGHYVILDGYLRYKACQQLDIDTVPCMVYVDKQAYSFNRNVNRLSAFQEMRMLRKTMESIDEPTIAQAFGMKTIRYRLAPTLIKQLHPAVVEAFKEDLIGKICATTLLDVEPKRQAEIMEEMKERADFSPSFCRALVIQTPESMRNKKRLYNKTWCENDGKKKDMVARLEHAEQQHDFYTGLYRQYSTDLMRLSFYIRKLISNPRIGKHLAANYPEILARFSEIVSDGSAQQ
jgi:hypothetical protein